MSEPRHIEEADLADLVIDVASPSADSPSRKAAWDEIKRRVRQPASEPANEPTCAICGHEWRRHDPEDGRCDAPSESSVCKCGSDLDWMNGRAAELSRVALAAARGDTQP